MTCASGSGSPLNYTVYGHAGPWLTLVHGGLVDSTTWHQHAVRLAAWGRVLTYDVRGYGKSGGSRAGYRVGDHARDLIELWDVVGVERGFVAGFSLGGLIAQEVALRAPERVEGLVLVSTAGCLGEAAQQGYRERAQRLERNGIRAEVDTHLRRAFSETFRDEQPEVIVRYRDQVAAASPEVVADSFRAVAGFDRLDDVSAIRCPTLVVAGDQDAGMGVGAATELQARIPDATLTILRGAGHTLHVEEPSTFIHLLADFLAQHSELSDDSPPWSQ